MVEIGLAVPMMTLLVPQSASEMRRLLAGVVKMLDKKLA
jgi:hypothetical protein